MPNQTITAYVVQMWTEMNDSERAGVRFGLFPAERIEQAKKDGFDSRKICMVLLDCADHNG